jgi:hypothetical protein
MEIYHCNNKQESGKIECFLFLYLEWFFTFQPTYQTKDYEIGICCFSAKHNIKKKEQRLVGSES